MAITLAFAALSMSLPVGGAVVAVYAHWVARRRMARGFAHNKNGPT